MSADQPSAASRSSCSFNELAQRYSDSVAKDANATSTSTPTSASALARNGSDQGDVSERLKLLLAPCQSEREIKRELWDDLEVHRRSADTYLNRFLDCLKQEHKQRSGEIYEINDSEDEALPTDTDMIARGQDSDAAGPTRIKWRLKIMSDSLSRDLLAMDEVLELLKKRGSDPSPKKSYVPVTACSVVASYVLWQLDHPVVALGIVTINVAGVAYTYSPVIGDWLRTDLIQRSQEDVKALLRHLKRGELDEQNRGDLHRISFRMLDQFRK